jgi:hypothetical protein
MGRAGLSTVGIGVDQLPPGVVLLSHIDFGTGFDQPAVGRDESRSLSVGG